MSPPVVSIAIRAYRRTWLREAIVSVLRQTWRDLELVVYDDAGGLDDVVLSIQDPRIRYHRASGAAGPAGRYAAAVALCRGRYIGVLDDDDWYEPTFVERLVEKLDADPRVAIAACRSEWSVDGVRVPGDGGPWPSHPNQIARALLTGECVLRTSMMLVRADALIECVRRQPAPDDSGPDVYYPIQLCSDGWRAERVDEVLLVSRWHDGQLTRAPERVIHLLIQTYSALHLTDPLVIATRDWCLARAFLARAAGGLRTGDRAGARKDIRRAAQSAPWAWGPRRAMLHAAAMTGWLGMWLARQRAPRRLPPRA